MVIVDDSLSEVKWSIAVHFTIVPSKPSVTLATDAIEVNEQDVRVEFLVIVNIIPLINSVVRGDTLETSLVLESAWPGSDWSTVIFHSIKLKLVLHMKWRSSPTQTDTAPGFDCVNTIDLIPSI